MTAIKVEARQVTRPWEDTLAWVNANGGEAWSGEASYPTFAGVVLKIRGVPKKAPIGSWVVRLLNGWWLVVSGDDWKMWVRGVSVSGEKEQ